jgi:segregation and condensation protein B
MSHVDPADTASLAGIIEAALLAAGRPLNLKELLDLFAEHERPDREALEGALEILEKRCAERSVELVKVASGWRLQVRTEYAPWVSRLWEERAPRYSRALMETLAVIAYRQPVTRGDIEDVRGVSVSSTIMRTLLDRRWIKVVGNRDVPGRPALYGTTREFLDYFGLQKLTELPQLEELKDLDQINVELDFGPPTAAANADDAAGASAATERAGDEGAAADSGDAADGPDATTRRADVEGESRWATDGGVTDGGEAAEARAAGGEGGRAGADVGDVWSGEGTDALADDDADGGGREGDDRRTRGAGAGTGGRRGELRLATVTPIRPSLVAVETSPRPAGGDADAGAAADDEASGEVSGADAAAAPAGDGDGGTADVTAETSRGGPSESAGDVTAETSQGGPSESAADVTAETPADVVAETLSDVTAEIASEPPAADAEHEAAAGEADAGDATTDKVVAEASADETTAGTAGDAEDEDEDDEHAPSAQPAEDDEPTNADDPRHR